MIHVGSLKVGSNISIPIRITNFGNDMLRVANASSTNSVFILTGVPGTAASGQVVQAAIEFKPTAIQKYQGSIVISSNSLTQFDTIILDGEGTAGNSVVEGDVKGFSLEQNYPNPFVSATTIKYSLDEKNFVHLTVFDPLGREIITIANNTVDPGLHSIPFDGSGLVSGLYYYTLHVGSKTATKSMILIK